jgi:hypothetical protein
MDRFMLAPETAGVAAVARMRVQQSLGYGWHPVADPCAISNFDMANTTKRPPRRLGLRST